MSNNVTLDRTRARREAQEIAKVFSHKKKKRQSSACERPLTPGEKLKLRKRKKADQEVEKLKKITVSSYAENRRKCSKLKERQTKVSVALSLIPGKDESFDNENNVDDDLLTLVDLNIAQLNNLRDYTHCFGEEEDSDEDVKKNICKYTNCFGEDEDEEDGDNKDEDEDVFEDEFPTTNGTVH